MKRLVVYGGCQAQQLGLIFSASATVSSVFEVRVQWTGDQARQGHEWAAEIAAADVVLVQHVPELEAFPAEHWSGTRAKILTYPVLTLSALWPFDMGHGEFDPELVVAQQSGRGLEFPFQDRLLAQLRHLVPDEKTRLEAYRTLSCLSLPEIVEALAGFDPATHLERYLAQCLAALRRNDKKHGLSVGGTIAARCRVAPVFHSVAHPVAAVLRQLGGELMAKLDLQMEPQSSLADGFSGLQVPIHPIVAKTLGLTWALDRKLWNRHGHDITFDQYYREYIETFG